MNATPTVNSVVGNSERRSGLYPEQAQNPSIIEAGIHPASSFVTSS
jgi:hypothetical protein